MVADDQIDACIAALIGSTRTGEIGDGKIFASNVEQVIRIRTGEQDGAAL